MTVIVIFLVFAGIVGVLWVGANDGPVSVAIEPTLTLPAAVRITNEPVGVMFAPSVTE